MREQIIKYLQGMQCGWFPVEWDSFVYNYLGIQGFYSEEKLKNVSICYTFLKDKYLINYGSMDGDLGLVIPYSYYFNLDRCEMLLLNAVRSVDEPKRKAAGKKIKRYEIYGGNTVYVYYRGGSDMVWQDGEFK